MVNITVEIMHDDDNLYNPREDDNYGIMACAHKRYSLSDEGEEIQVGEFSSWEEVEEYLIKECGAIIILPLWLYDHSGISISTRSFLGRAHHADWDSGRVGFIYTTRERIERMQGWKKLTKKRLEAVEKYLEGEIKVFDQYLTGDVYGYRISVDDEEVDSCWGIFGLDWAKKEALMDAEAILKKEVEDMEVTHA